MENTDERSSVKCNPHPDAPHGFLRDASHSAGRYVCECESWEPPKREWVGLTDEEIEECFVITPDQFLKRHTYKRIEAKLKEKNGG